MWMPESRIPNLSMKVSPMHIRGMLLAFSGWLCTTCALAGIMVLAVDRGEHKANHSHSLTFAQRLDTRVALFNAYGQTLAQAVLCIAYHYKLPMGVEYWTPESTRIPLRLRLRNQSVRQILETLVAKQPGYRVSFSGGCVQVYTPQGRSDPSNLLNTIIPRFHVTDEDPVVVSASVFEALVHIASPGTSVVESTAVGSPLKITLDLRNVRVYEILDAIAAQKGGAGVWVVRVPPDRLSVLGGDLWYLYPLDPAFKQAVLQDVMSLFPHDKSR